MKKYATRLITIKGEETPVKLPKDPFAYIAFYQFLTFIMLLLLVWYNETADLKAIVFHTQPQDGSFERAYLLSAFVLVTAVIVVGNTYLQQRRVLNAMLSVCANCHRVQINEHQWTQMEEYISDNSLLTFTHGLCPTCLAEVMQTMGQTPGSTQNPAPGAGALKI